MRINVLQHTPNEGPGAIALWAQQHQHTNINCISIIRINFPNCKNKLATQ